MNMYIRGLFHEREFLMDKVEDKALEFYARLKELRWETLVQPTGDNNKEWVWEL